MTIPIKEVFGWLLVFTGVFDAVKYSLQALKIKQVKTAKAMSRKFINFALLNDFVKFGYGIIIADLFIVITSIISLICMIDLFIAIYWFYPYRKRGLINFRRPNIFIYTINSILPNRIRRRL